MKVNFFKIVFLGILLTFCSCGDDFLTLSPSDKVEAGNPSLQSINQNLTSAYQILLMDSYANANYNSLTLMGDLRSDDIYKGGGDANDQAALYYLSQFKNTPGDVPSGWWSIYYTGLSRCNTALQGCDDFTPVGERENNELNRMRAEARALRAYYLHLLWKMWGNVPYFDKMLVEPYLAKQYSADEIYQFIIADLDYAIADDKLPLAVSGSNTGRVSKAMAQMTKARVVMYQKDRAKYNEVLKDMVEIINSKQYELVKNFQWMFLRDGEFCKESIFETNQISEGKTWGDSWTGYGTNLPAFISPSGLVDPKNVFIDGWGFAPVREAAYAIFESGDQRKAVSVNDFRTGGYTYNPRYQNTGLFLGKYAARKDYNLAITGDAPLNFENNLRIYRLAETYLNAAELLVAGATAAGAASAQNYLDAVRDRAFESADRRIPATLDNIKLERRRELFGEGCRYWDLVRWGDTNLLTDSNDNNSTRKWDAAKNKYLPIPQGEIDKAAGKGEFELVQNPY